MKLPLHSRFKKSDFPDLPETFIPILDKLNSDFEHLYNLAQHAIDFEANMLAEVREVELHSGVEATVILQRLKAPPIGVLLIGSSLYDTTLLKWRHSDTANAIDVTVAWASTPSNPVTATLLVIGK